jgi:hypothetical protein
VPKLVNDGRRILGVHFQFQAAVHWISLVAEDKTK